jgi:hypothetical protein
MASSSHAFAQSIGSNGSTFGSLVAEQGSLTLTSVAYYGATCTPRVRGYLNVATVLNQRRTNTTEVHIQFRHNSDGQVDFRQVEPGFGHELILLATGVQMQARVRDCLIKRHAQLQSIDEELM